MAKLREEDEKLKKKIKQRLFLLREKLGDSKSDVSKNIDVDRQNFQPWENLKSDRGITIYSLNRICKALGITLKEFFDDELFR
ncbi:XRE family transcriptional regulator [Aequorivita sp. F47161]|uniref:XRE family transcriptional regulator n=1 Tax=Aequorivita vitellina TaxID=2874475 RepID=A0A9X1QYE3_9FLAO|nr:helix-turn-helix domain-containing protein [Aequorivita vitellina]MCG2419383.1 XRE family transcriptional regulator [Aequorivita vitellina]